MEKKYFTLDEANQLLPFIKTELAYLQETKTAFYKKYHELQQIKKDYQDKEKDKAYEDMVFKLECSLEFMEMEAQMHINNMHAKGIQVKDIDIGLFDFPAIIDGKEVLLCWKQDETAISFYHGLHDGFTGRKKIE